MTISEGSVSVHGGLTTGDLGDDQPVTQAPSDADTDAPELTDEALERSKKLGAWMEVGATSLPALLVALGSALAGAITMVIRRRRRR